MIVRNGRGRVVYASLSLLVSLLAVFRAPTYHLWMLSIIVTEWGHMLAVLALLPFAPGWSSTRGGRYSVVISLAASFIFLTPLQRSFPVASALPQSMEAAFGPSNVTSTPLSFKNLLMGVPLTPVRVSTERYARSCGAIQLGLVRSALRGYAVASVDYGLAPRSIFPGPVEDLRDALSFLKSRSSELSLDPSRVILLGRSAGGQIALAAAHDPEPFPGLKGVVVFYGPNDLLLAWREPGPKRMIDSRRLLRQYLGGSPAEEPERYARASPILSAGKKSPPTLMIHGGRDEMVWPLHEYRLSEKLEAAGVPHYFLNMPWATHGCDYNFNGPCGQASTYAVERFLGFALR